MIIAALKERTPGETRVAITPEIAQKYLILGQKVIIEQNAGLAAGFHDNEYRKSGAIIAKTAAEILQHADLLPKIWSPLPAETKLFKFNQIVVANFQSFYTDKQIDKFAQTGATGFALERLPRISKTQSMDILSSQSNLAGYRAVIEAFALLSKSAPLLITAAGTVAPAKVLVLGAGVAGLQAIATAKRLGAIVYASDSRPAAQEQVESLGGRFIAVTPDTGIEDRNGYSKTASTGYLRRQKAAITAILPQTDIIITTAQIPGKPAPKLIDSAMLNKLPFHSVIIDMAISAGGNVAGSKEGVAGTKKGVRIYGNSNFAAKLPFSASNLFAQNIYNFLVSQYNPSQQTFDFNFSDDIIKQVCVVKAGINQLHKEHK